MKAVKLLCVGVAICCSSGQGFSQAGGAPGQALDLDGLKAKCAELTGNEQLKPFAAVISCSSRETFWKESAERPPFQLNNSLEYGISVKMKGLQMPFTTVADTTTPTEGTCTVFEKWSRTIPDIETKKTCAEIMAVNDLTELCKPFLAASVTENPSLLMEEKTGELFNSCRDAVPLPEGQPGTPLE
jgi:hypothetical protein